MPQFESWLKLYSSKRLEIRIRAANGILDHADDAPLDVLIDILCSLAHQGLGAAAEKALLKRTDVDLVPRMIALLESGDQFVRETACTVLGRSGDFAATPHLLRMIDDPKMMVRRAAGFGLAFLKDDSVVPELHRQLHNHRDDDTNVVWAIRSALRSLGQETPASKDDCPLETDPNDPLSLYVARAYERLSETRHGVPCDELDERVVEVFFLPSFHPETLIRVWQNRPFTMLRMSSMTSSLWYYECETGFGQHQSKDSSHNPPELIEEAYVLECDFSAQFWSQIDRLMAEGVKSTSNAGCDGISVRAFHRYRESRTSFEAWSPDPDSPQGLFVGKLFDLAWKAVTDDTMMQRLEQIYGYLRGDLPIRWIENEIKTLRVFGSLTSHDEDRIRSLFASLPKDEPLVLDLTNFDGMGTILYPTIREFASQHDQLAWACSAAAAKHLQLMGIDARGIFESVRQAVEYIRSQMEGSE